MKDRSILDSIIRSSCTYAYEKWLFCLENCLEVGGCCRGNPAATNLEYEPPGFGGFCSGWLSSIQEVATVWLDRLTATVSNVLTCGFLGIPFTWLTLMVIC
jgi:hypothetical protein